MTLIPEEMQPVQVLYYLRLMTMCSLELLELEFWARNVKSNAVFFDDLSTLLF